MNDSEEIIYPKKLTRGSTLGLITVSSPTTEDRKEKFAGVMRKLGYKVKMADNLTESYGGYGAGCAEKRARLLNKMFEDPEIDGIMCVRGGYGASAVTEYVDLDAVRKNPKAFIGFSDVTALHLLFNQECGLVTFHGPMVSSNMLENFEPETEKSFYRAVAMPGPYEFTNPKGTPVEVMKAGKASGRVTGGNLSLLSASMGTPYEMDSKDKIIFIEEVNEPIGRVERLARHLKLCGKFSCCRGVLLGQFKGCDNIKDKDFGPLEVFRDVLCAQDIPVMYNLQSGHGRPMMTIPLLSVCHMDTVKKTILFCLEKENLCQKTKNIKNI